jgi:uncharacterized protein (TIRG00374 family)
MAGGAHETFAVLVEHLRAIRAAKDVHERWVQPSFDGVNHRRRKRLGVNRHAADTPQAGLEAAARATPMSRRFRILLTLLGLGISAFFIWLAIDEVSLSEVRRSLSNADYVWLIPTLALTYLTLLLRGLRWRYLFSNPRSVSTWNSIGAVNVGLMFNNLLPSRAGEIPRTFALRRVSGLSAFEIGTTILVERILDVFTVALLGLVLAPWLPDRNWIDVLVLICLGVAIGTVLFVLGLALFRDQVARLMLALVRKLPFVSETRGHMIVEAVVAGGRVLLRPKRLLVALALSALVWACAALSCLALMPAFDFDATSLAPWLIVIANSFAVAVPSGPATVGVYEASVQAPLVAYGVAASPALSYAIVLHAANFLPIILTGIVASWLMLRGEAHPRQTHLATSERGLQPPG